MIYRPKTVLNQKAFTIIELLIATAILSVILVLVTAMMLGIGNLYYKGTTQTDVQDNVRDITNVIAQDLQLNGSALLSQLSASQNNPSAYCIGTTRYTFILGKQIVSQSNHVLWRDTIPAAATCTPADLTAADPSTSTGGSNGSELIGANSMLTAFSITGSSPFTISVGEAYGNIGLLCDSGNPVGDCTLTTNSTRIWNPSAPTGQILCKGLSGSQLCSTDYLTTTVTERL